MTEIMKEIACDFDPEKVCPLKQNIESRRNTTDSLIIRGMTSFYTALDKHGLAPAGILTTIVNVVPETCDGGPSGGIMGRFQACNGQAVFGHINQ